MKSKKWPLILCGVILLLGIIGSILVLQKPKTNMVAIIRDNQVLYQFDLRQAKDQIIEIQYEGRGNTVEIRDHQIHMLAAECPDNTCVHMGWLDSAAPIVCLPNHLIIEFSGNGERTDAVIR